MLPLEEGVGMGNQVVRKKKSSIFAFLMVLAISLYDRCLVS